MWLKLCLLLIYISLLFLLSRVLEIISLFESGYGGALSQQLLDPMLLSVVRLKALLEQRGVSYEGVVEKSELTNLVDASGQVTAEEAEISQMEEADCSETNFTSGGHFIEQVEDAKDSVWLVQVVSHNGQYRILSDSRWRSVRLKASRFGVRTGFLDCSLDVRYCHQKGWHSPFLLLALPSQFEKKAQVALYNYSGSVKETSVIRWVRDKLDEKIARIKDPHVFQRDWQNFSGSALDPEIRAVLVTQSTSAPLFYSALSVKFPGRVKFGLISFNSVQKQHNVWRDILEEQNIFSLPAYMIFTAERTYIYGLKPGELYSFASMERFFRFLHPCLNDIFIISFVVANILSWFEFFISNCSFFKRLRKFLWCMLKYNVIVIMLWLPIIGIFQMPYLDRIPLLALKMERVWSTSYFGTILRGDYSFYLYHLHYVFLSFGLYSIFVTYLCKKYRQETPDEEDWFNFSQMGTLTHLRPNDFFEPMRISGYDLMGGLEVFGSHLSQPSLWLQPAISPEYIKHLPTWRYCPQPLAARAAENVRNIELAMTSSCQENGNKRTKSSDNASQMDSHRGHKDLACKHTPVHNKNALRKLSTPYCHMSSVSPSVAHQSGLDQRVHASSSSQCCDQQPPMFHKKEPASATLPACSCSHRSDSMESRPSSSFSSMETGTRNSDSVSSSLASESFHSCHSFSNRPMALTSTHDPAACPALPTSSGFPAGYLECHQCVICLEEYTLHTMLCGLPCGHVFHETCIISWLNREKHFCPMCRWPSYKLQQPPNQLRQIATGQEQQ